MKVIHLSTSDYNGGAAIAAKRIVTAQRLFSDLDSKLLVQTKKYNDNFIFSADTSTTKKILSNIRQVADELSIRLLSVQSRGRFTFPYFGQDISQNDLIKNADIINLHWINGGFLSLNSLVKLSQLNKPIVWTLHDMWAFTGGCHYNSDCFKFQTQCFDCPSLLFKSENDLSYKIFNGKKKIFADLKPTIVTCSKWLAKEASQSALLNDKKVIVIPNSIDLNVYTPINKIESRQKINLPIDKKLILIGAMNLKDYRKGFNYLVLALNLLADSNKEISDKFEMVVFGKLDKNVTNQIPLKINQLGKLKNEEEIVMAYNAADIYVAPSLQDNLPNTIMEAMACGVPVVAFNVGGIPDLIDDGVNGILVELKSSEDLAKAIEKILLNENLSKKFSIAARQKILNDFDQKIVAAKYYELYKSIL